MRLRGQRGQTLIELLIGVTVASLILGALAGLMYTVNDRFQHWGDRLDSATDGFGIASAIQADSHRYYPCGPSSGLTLALCEPTARCQPAVVYASRLQNGGWVITRQEHGSTTLVDRTRLSTQPTFTVSGAVIQVSAINQALYLSVFYHPPVHAC